MAPGLRVGGLTPLTTIDYPGELAAVVFCQGCPWRCRYCHNSHLLEATGAGRMAGRMAWPTVMAFLERRRGLLDAVVFSGGEPLAQGDLPAAMASVRALGFKVGLHTAGCYPARLERVLPLADWVGLDIKALPEDYPATTGVPDSGRHAWQSLNHLVASHTPHEVRVTVHSTLLPPKRLEALTDRLIQAGAATVVHQKCNPTNALDPDLGTPDEAWVTRQARRPEGAVVVRG
ncbi:MAG: anaerobic ribonucleoside-triphosphate reductase activating protein [Gammaproteobacteria bacterium]|nr:anaerobic ribonucleoside-triphosphate reductase activating protein [Gammaproteobacteria bacterium]